MSKASPITISSAMMRWGFSKNRLDKIKDWDESVFTLNLRDDVLPDQQIIAK